MKFEETFIEGAFRISPSPIQDDRGLFARVWCRQEFEDHGLHPKIVQVNVGYSHRAGTVRGMHFQRAPHEEIKIVRCTRGAVFDVVADLREDSATFGRWVGYELTEDNRDMLYVPEGCAHGYQTLVDRSEIEYHTSVAYAPAAASGVRFNDPALAIEWPLEVSAISDQDRQWDLLSNDGKA